MGMASEGVPGIARRQVGKWFRDQSDQCIVQGDQGVFNNEHSKPAKIISTKEKKNMGNGYQDISNSCLELNGKWARGRGNSSKKGW